MEAELASLVHQAGLSVEALRGDYQGAPFSESRSAQMIWELRRAAGEDDAGEPSVVPRRTLEHARLREVRGTLQMLRDRKKDGAGRPRVVRLR